MPGVTPHCPKCNSEDVELLGIHDHYSAMAVGDPRRGWSQKRKPLNTIRTMSLEVSQSFVYSPPLELVQCVGEPKGSGRHALHAERWRRPDPHFTCWNAIACATIWEHGGQKSESEIGGFAWPLRSPRSRRLKTLAGAPGLGRRRPSPGLSQGRAFEDQKKFRNLCDDLLNVPTRCVHLSTVVQAECAGVLISGGLRGAG
jgi:hypothetical protein